MRGLPQKRHFNPRTREGCDAITRAREKLMYVFQSTHPWRVRLDGWLYGAGNARISIHAPVKGATPSFFADRCSRWYFNPRTREGCDTRYSRPACGRSWFQSTHPWRVRHSYQQSSHDSNTYFNPRTREGCDVREIMYCINDVNFNPRTREGCDSDRRCGPCHR